MNSLNLLKNSWIPWVLLACTVLQSVEAMDLLTMGLVHTGFTATDIAVDAAEDQLSRSTGSLNSAYLGFLLAIEDSRYELQDYFVTPTVTCRTQLERGTNGENLNLLPGTTVQVLFRKRLKTGAFSCNNAPRLTCAYWPGNGQGLKVGNIKVKHLKGNFSWMKYPAKWKKNREHIFKAIPKRITRVPPSMRSSKSAMNRFLRRIIPSTQSSGDRDFINTRSRNPPTDENAFMKWMLQAEIILDKLSFIVNNTPISSNTKRAEGFYRKNYTFGAPVSMDEPYTTPAAPSRTSTKSEERRTRDNRRQTVAPGPSRTSTKSGERRMRNNKRQPVTPVNETFDELDIPPFVWLVAGVVILAFFGMACILFLCRYNNNDEEQLSFSQTSTRFATTRDRTHHGHEKRSKKHRRKHNSHRYPLGRP